MVDTYTFELLIKLLEPEFEEVISRAGVPRHYLSSSQAPRATRVTELVQWAKQSDANERQLLQALAPGRQRETRAPVTTASRGVGRHRRLGLFDTEETPV